MSTFSGQGFSGRPGMRMCGAAVLFLFCNTPQLAGAASSGRLKAHILLNGQPYAASLTISDGVYWKTFREVTYLDEVVPADATYSIEASVAPGGVYAGGVTFRDVIPNFRIKPDALTEIKIHLLPGSEAKAFSPVVLIEDVLAQAQVSSSISRPSAGSFRLNSRITGYPGARLMLDTIVEPLNTNEGYLCAAPCPHLLPAAVDCSVYCFTCSSTAVLVGNVWKENFNLCNLTLDTGGSGEVASTFERFAAGTGGMVLNAALWNAAIVKPARTELKNVATGRTWVLRPPFTVRSFPDFVVPAGAYLFTFVPPEGSGPQTERNVVIPMAVKEREISSLYLEFPADGFKDFEPAVLGDNRLGLVVKGLRHNHNGRSLALEVRDSGFKQDAAWVAAPVAADSLPGRVTVTLADAKQTITLRENYDYTLNPKSGRLLVIIKVRAGGGLYTVTF